MNNAAKMNGHALLDTSEEWDIMAINAKACSCSPKLLYSSFCSSRALDRMAFAAGSSISPHSMEVRVVILLHSNALCSLSQQLICSGSGTGWAQCFIVLEMSLTAQARLLLHTSPSKWAANISKTAL